MGWWGFQWQVYNSPCLLNVENLVTMILLNNRSVQVVTFEINFDKNYQLKSFKTISLFCSSETQLLYNASVNSSCAQPPPPPRATAGHLPALSVPGVGHLEILHCPGAGHLPAPGRFQSFWHARSFLSQYNYTQGFTAKKADWLICQGQEGINWREL